jgi:hypothetical protein
MAKHFGDRYRYEVAESADKAWEVIEEIYLQRFLVLY